MLWLRFSNNLQQLAQFFRKDSAQVRQTLELPVLEPTTLLVPNRSLDRFVLFDLAKHEGIAANIQAEQLEHYVPRLVNESSDHVRILTKERLTILLLGVLRDQQVLQQEVMKPVADYLGHAGTQRDSVERRRVEIAMQLAEMFVEYSSSRPQLVQAWSSGTSSMPDGYFQQVEAWQQALWNQLFGERGYALEDRAAIRLQYRFLADVWQAIPTDKLRLPAAVYLFGFHTQTPGFQAMLTHWSKNCQVFLYTFNPCREYWEDILTESEIRVLAQESKLEIKDTGVFADHESRLLRWWGKAGREHLKSLTQLSSPHELSVFVDYQQEQVDTHLLNQIQQEVLSRGIDYEQRPQLSLVDSSIVILPCPGIRRELEIVAAEIWSLVAEAESCENPMRLDQIAVIVPTSIQEQYIPHLEAVFRDAYDLPYSLYDMPLSFHSPVLEAVELLLQLPQTSFTRQEVFRIIAHPILMSQYEDIDPESWAKWVDRVGVVHGVDRDDHQQTYIKSDRFNWNQGLLRLALGSVMFGERSGASEAVWLGGEPYLPEEVNVAEGTAFARFALLVRSLLEDARFAQKAELTLPEWASFLRSYVSAYVRTKQRTEQRDLERILKTIHEISDHQVGEQHCSLVVAVSLLKQSFQKLTQRFGVRGVAVGSLQALHSLEFHTTFVVGLNDGSFPSPQPRNPLDLRFAQRSVRDISNVEQELYLFLNRLLSTRQQLFLSYVDRHPITGEAQKASSVVEELLLVIAATAPPEFDSKSLFRSHQLRRYRKKNDEPPGAPPNVKLPEEIREEQVAGLRDQLQQQLQGPLGDVELEVMKNHVPEGHWQRLRRLLGLVEPPDNDPLLFLEEHDRFSVVALRKFLECPLQGVARYMLHLDERFEEDLSAVEDEPWSLSYLETLLLTREAMSVALCENRNEIKVLEELIALSRLRGKLPEGLFGEVERRKQMAVLQRWRQHLQADWPSQVPRAAIYRFGIADEHTLVDKLYEPLSLPLRVLGGRDEPWNKTVSLLGQTEVVLDGIGSLVLVQRPPRSGPGVKIRMYRDALRGFFDLLLLRAAGLLDEQPYHIVICNADTSKKADRLTFRPMEQEQAHTYLTHLATDLVTQSSPVFFPCDAAFMWRGGQAGEPLDEILDRLQQSGQHASRGPVAHPERFRRPSLDEAMEIYQRRYSIFFDFLTND
jgi:exodeoxyribonuclease V gamma subunit